jgi:uncharacterized membrane protein
MAKTSLKVKAARKPKFKVRGYTRCQRLEFAASASVKWRTVVNFQVSQRRLGKTTNEKSPDKLFGY